MPYTTSSAPVLIGRPGYSAEHYDFAFSGTEALGGLYDDAQRAVNLAKAGNYTLAASVVNRQKDPAERNYVLTFLKNSVSAEQYREVLRHTTTKATVTTVTSKNGSGFSLSKAGSFLKSSLLGGGGGAVPSGGGGPNYLLWGGVAAGGLILVLLLTRKPKPAAPANGSK